jgi:intermediate peptidase
MFEVRGLRQPDDFPRIALERVKDARRVMNDWKNQQDSTIPAVDIETLDNVSNSLCQIADSAEFLRNVEDDSRWIEAATDAVQVVSSFMNEANLSVDFYERADSIMHHGDRPGYGLDDEHKRVISSMVESMKNEGVHLPPADKSRLIDLQTSDVTRSFNIVQSTGESANEQGVWLRASDQLSQSPLAKILPKRSTGGFTEFLIPVDRQPLITQLLKDIDCRATRQVVWEAGNKESSANAEKRELMHELIHTRREMAKIRGYRSWNDYAQRESIMTPLGGPAAVKEFLVDLWERLASGISVELDTLARSHSGNSVEPWDLDFLIDKWKLRNNHATVSTSIIQSQLTFQRILAGGQKVLDSLFDVDLQYDKECGRLWHPDAFRLSLSRGGMQPFAYMYLDPYLRDSKSVQSAQFTIAGSKLLPGGLRQKPQTAIVLSLPPRPDIPLPISVAQTFFHELGHATHSLLSETSLQHFSGSRGAIDFVEFPSHLFEYFATDPAALKVTLGNEIDPSIIDDYASRRNPFAHLEVAQQLTYALIDQVYYETGSPNDLSKYLPQSGVVDTSKVLELLQPGSVANFEHLVHYGGSYYCYLLCRALASDVWSNAFRHAPFSRESGRRLEAFLRRGSVDQSLAAIYAIDGKERPGGRVSLDAFLEELRSCKDIHTP